MLPELQETTSSFGGVGQRKVPVKSEKAVADALRQAGVSVSDIEPFLARITKLQEMLETSNGLTEMYTGIVSSRAQMEIDNHSIAPVTLVERIQISERSSGALEALNEASILSSLHRDTANVFQAVVKRAEHHFGLLRNAISAKADGHSDLDEAHLSLPARNLLIGQARIFSRNIEQMGPLLDALEVAAVRITEFLRRKLQST